MALLVKPQTLDVGSGQDLRMGRWCPRVQALGVEPAWDSLSPSDLTPSFKVNKLINKSKVNFTVKI